MTHLSNSSWEKAAPNYAEFHGLGERELGGVGVEREKISS